MKEHSRELLLLGLFFIVSGNCFSQGYLMYAGGGAESWGGWSDAPYAWVVDHAANKKVAVVSYVSGQTEWLPNYFKSLGALRADNIYIGSYAAANTQSMYDSLMKYDAIFLKGGDQHSYYEYFRNSKTVEALRDVYVRGGVLSGTSAGAAILSPIVFTAEVTSVDPSAALLNAYNSQITLADDFLDIHAAPYIIDTHFAERGRFGRLPAFMAAWYAREGVVATGIGVDDHTAFCLSANGRAEVFGTGAVCIMKAKKEGEAFDSLTKMLRSEEMDFIQLLHGCSVDMTSMETEGLEESIEVLVEEENMRNTVLFCGTDYVSDEMGAYFVNSCGNKGDRIAIVTGLSMSKANIVKDILEASGAKNVELIQALSGAQGNAVVQEIIEGSEKFVMIDLPLVDFVSFLKGWGNGPRLEERLKTPGICSFWVGRNARYAGKTVVDNWENSDATSYHGLLAFEEGLGLLETTAIMPYAFISSDYYENTVTGLPYAMLRDGLKYGLYVTGTTFAEYGFSEDGQSYFKNVSGFFPLIFLSNEGDNGGFASEGPDASSRNIAGFERMRLRFLAPGDSVICGRNVPEGIREEELGEELRVYPNPVSSRLIIQEIEKRGKLELMEMTGRKVLCIDWDGRTAVDVSGLPEGVYVLRVREKGCEENHVTNIIIERD